ncbi:translation initiation factor IF-2-like [Cervus elaphus]|uniref:translation initiation factor IF-2-like n=1 Tax=Cervus elaphus TaxID=9860 RepID=UPI001CC32FBC|nr:translation initiation factor IF-2-like [Cervus elaphus]
MSAGRGTQWNERGRAKQPRVCRERGGGEAPGTSMSRLNISLYYCVALLPSLPAGPGRQGTGAPWVPWGRSGVVRSPLWRDLGSARVRPQNSLGWKRNPSSDLGRPPWWKPIRSERAGAPAPLEWLQSRTQRTSAPPTLWPLPDIRRSDCVSEIPGAPRNYLPRNLWLARLPPGIKDTDCATPAVCGRRGPQRAPGSSHSLHSEFSLKGEGQSWGGGGAEERAPQAEDPAVGARPRATQVAEEPRRARRPPPPAGPLRAPVLPAARRRRKRRGRPTPAGSCARRPRPAPHRPPGSPPLAPRTVGSGGEKREQPCLPPAPSTFFVVVVAFPRWLNVT